MKRSSNVHVPLIGLGTYKFKKGSGMAHRAVLNALSLGYRHIDTAFIYAGETTEKEVGEALEIAMSESSPELPIPRSDIFLTTKQWRTYHGYEPTLECLDLSLKRLKVDYVDLYLIHWPGPAYNTMCRSKDVMENSSNGAFAYAKEGHEVQNMQSLRAETWRAMEDSVYNGKCRAIGVSNFTIKHLEALRKTARIWPPALNQIELHPYNPQTELVEYCQKHGIVVEAYASLGGQDSGKKTWNILGGKLVERKEVCDIAEKYQKAPTQVLLKWASKRNIVVIPKSTNVAHLRENLDAVVDKSWSLDDGDMALLASISSSIQDKEKIEKTRLCWVRDPLKMLDFE